MDIKAYSCATKRVAIPNEDCTRHMLLPGDSKRDRLLITLSDVSDKHDSVSRKGMGFDLFPHAHGHAPTACPSIHVWTSAVRSL